MPYVVQMLGLAHCREMNRDAMKIYQKSGFNAPWKYCLFKALSNHRSLLREQEDTLQKRVRKVVPREEQKIEEEIRNDWPPSWEQQHENGGLWLGGSNVYGF